MVVIYQSNMDTVATTGGPLPSNKITTIVRKSQSFSGRSEREIYAKYF